MSRFASRYSIAAIVLRAIRTSAVTSFFEAQRLGVNSPCFRAFLLPLGAPPEAPCIRQTLCSCTAGARYRRPLRFDLAWHRDAWRISKSRGLFLRFFFRPYPGLGCRRCRRSRALLWRHGRARRDMGQGCAIADTSRKRDIATLRGRQWEAVSVRSVLARRSTRGCDDRAQRSARVLPKAPNKAPQRLALGNGLASVEPVTVGAVSLAAGRSATFRPAMQPAPLLAFRRGLLAEVPGSRSGQATRRQAHSPLQQSGRQCPSSPTGPPKPRCSEANHNGVRVDLRVIERSIPSHQIGSHQDIGSAPGRVLRGSLLCTVEPRRPNEGGPHVEQSRSGVGRGSRGPAPNGPCGRRRRSLRRRLSVLNQTHRR